ncbi:chromosome partition protein Smc [Pleomorphomonas sp. SM30]|nr:chromosome partition protein Smc [Pleomorphomonas sp. SM30]
MLVRLNRVRPGGERAAGPAAGGAAAGAAPARGAGQGSGPARRPAAAVPAVAPEAPGVPGPASPTAPAAPSRRVPLPQKQTGRGGLRIAGRNPSLDRLLAASRPRVSGSALSFLLMVALPTVVAALYFAFVASPQYVSEFRFAVRAQDAIPQDSLSAATAVSPISVLADNFVVADFARSRDVVDRLEAEVGLRRVYGDPDVDALSRFDPTASVEHLVKYWEGKVDAHFDMTTGINSIQVRAFSPDDAHTLAVSLQKLCEELVNSISEKARQTQVQYAEDQVARAERKLADVRARETEFRARVQTVDAAQSASTQIALAAKVEGDLTSMRAEYETVRRYLDDTSPRIKVLKDQIASTEAQLAAIKERVKVGGDANPTDARTIGEYETLKVDADVALKIYQAALQSYEQARLRALANQLYLATYVQPTMPQDAAYPRRTLDTFLFFLAALGIWVVSTLVFYSVRDHAH